MSRSKDNEGFGGSFSVDGQSVEIDMAEFGWDRPVSKNGGADRGAGAGSEFDDDPNAVRLQKALAAAGVASRRACETLITSGRVSVNGRICDELGSRVVPGTDEVRVDGVVVQLDASKRYFVLNKPRGVVSTMNDEHDRGDLSEFTAHIDERLYNVGRLDSETSGLLVLTNDGEVAHKLAHPSFGVQKTYIAKVRGRMTAAALQQLLDGITLADGEISADRAKILPDGAGRSHSLVEITLHSGRNRIVRRMLSAVGFPVEELVRRQFGPLHLGTLRVGEMRELSAAERGALLSVGEEGDDTERPVSGTAAAAAAKPASRKGWAKNKDRGPAARGASVRKAAARKARPAGDGEREGFRDRDRDREGYRGGRDDRGGAGRGAAEHGRERGGYRGRDERGGERGGYRGGRDDNRGDERGGYRGRDERNDRGSFERRDDRGDRGGRGFEGRDNRGFQGRDDNRGGRDGYRGRDDRGFQNRDDRGGRGGFDRRDDRDNRGDRGGRENRDDFRGGRDNFRGDRGDNRGRDERGGRDQFRGRDDRGGRDERNDRGGYRGRDDHGRDERGGYGRRDDRGFQGRGNRDERGGNDRRDDRGYRGDRDNREDRGERGYQGGRGNSDRGGQRNRGEITAGRPGDGKGARGMRGAAARGNPHRRSY